MTITECDSVIKINDTAKKTMWAADEKPGIKLVGPKVNILYSATLPAFQYPF